MRTVRTKVYQFNELSEKAQEKAIRDNNYINVEENWWRDTYEDAENAGIKITSFDLDRNRHAEGKFIISAYDCATKIVENHGESTGTYGIAKKFFDFWNEAVKTYSDGVNTDSVTDENADYFDEYVDDATSNFRRDILDAYATILQDESEYLLSDEAVKEILIANEYEFTANGTRFSN